MEDPRDAASIIHLISELTSSSASNQLAQQHRQELIGNLPRLHEADVISLGHRDSLCPICFTPVLALLAEEETALVMDSPAHPQEELGVTRLSQTWQCGHIFCRRDISKWIREGHDSCPTCRRLLLPPSAQSNSDSVNEPVVSESDAGFDSEDARALFEEFQDQMTIFGAPRYSFSNNIAGGPDNGHRDDYVGMYS